MRMLAAILLLPIAALAVQPARSEGPPAWAYPVNPPDFKPALDDGKPRSVPDSRASYTVPQTRDLFLAPVWHPEDHAALPDIVAHGRKPDVFACGFCHRANGQGGPENADLAGLPASYIVQQIADYKSGMRTTAVQNRAPQTLMISLAKSASDSEIAAAAAYFSSLKPRDRIRVVETDVVPKTFRMVPRRSW
jgi:cytochrome c553